ncbi:MAG: hypothetical protein CL489_08595 [Acidobacteria bacterium]|nr:hypothetical protein [Acidobacteriota bacterium]|tara:strand:- start:38815 stop:39111 length:297 start_codon:yes stop_codon:yes gene_type:complete
MNAFERSLFHEMVSEYNIKRTLHEKGDRVEKMIRLVVESSDKQEDKEQYFREIIKSAGEQFGLDVVIKTMLTEKGTEIGWVISSGDLNLNRETTWYMI